MRKPFTKQEVVEAIERTASDAKIPILFYKWFGNGLLEKYGAPLQTLADQFPEDIFTAWYIAPGDSVPTMPNQSYRWGFSIDYDRAETHGIGETKILLPDWDMLDAYFKEFPDPYEPGIFDPVIKALPEAEGRYKLGCWWSIFHERFWGIRGMENLMLDYYDNMEGLRKLGERLLGFYKVIVDRFAELGFDGIFTSDDLGHQRGPMMSPAVFEELYFPLYKGFCDHVHSKGMHVFLHSCGDNTLLMDSLIKAGIDVFHPVQTGCMDTKETAAKFGDRMSFLAGVDVQHLLPEGTQEEVRNGIRALVCDMYKPRGGLLLAVGNGIMPDTPFENIEEMFTQLVSFPWQE